MNYIDKNLEGMHDIIINNMNWFNKNVIINKGKCYYEHKSRVIWKNCWCCIIT